LPWGGRLTGSVAYIVNTTTLGPLPAALDRPDGGQLSSFQHCAHTHYRIKGGDPNNGQHPTEVGNSAPRLRGPSSASAKFNLNWDLGVAGVLQRSAVSSAFRILSSDFGGWLFRINAVRFKLFLEFRVFFLWAGLIRLS